MGKSFYYDTNENKWKSVRGHDSEGAVWVDDATEDEIREHLTKITELAEARAEIDRLNKNLRLLLCKTHFDKCEAGLFNSKNPDDEPCLICLMNAAERGE